MRFLHWVAAAGAAALCCTSATANDEPQAAAAKGASFYQESATGECSSRTCTVRLPKAAGGKVIETSNLSCFVTATGYSAPPYATFLAGPKLVSYMLLIPFAENGDTVAAGVLAGSVFVAKGQIPTVIVTGVVSASCTLSGKLISK